MFSTLSACIFNLLFSRFYKLSLYLFIHFTLDLYWWRAKPEMFNNSFKCLKEFFYHETVEVAGVIYRMGNHETGL